MYFAVALTLDYYLYMHCSPKHMYMTAPMDVTQGAVCCCIHLGLVHIYGVIQGEDIYIYSMNYNIYVQ